MFHSFHAAVAAARRHGDLYFAALLSEQSILDALGSASSLWQGWVYTPAVTLWVFLSQCLSSDHSCRDAVSRLAAWRVVQGDDPCSTGTGAYCTARDALPEAACHELVRRAEQWHWSSLYRWLRGSAEDQALLTAWPLSRKRNWAARVNAPQTELEMAAVRRSVQRGSPLGEPS